MTTLIDLTPDADAAAVAAELRRRGLWARPVAGSRGGRGFLADAGSGQAPPAALRAIPGVQEVRSSPSPHPLLDRWRGRAVAVRADLAVGPGEAPVLIAGPCAAESAAQVDEIAAAAGAAGARILRGGAFKPRTSPHSFRGHGARALRWLRDAADAHDLALMTEAVSEASVPAVAEVADVVQIGSRTMQAFGLLEAVGATGRPALLKRGRAATLAEWRLAGEHLLAAGAGGVIFCERGVLGADPELRNTFDLAGALALRVGFELPVVADPSHATGRADLVAPLARASLAAGLDGVMVEAHPDPGAARSDGPQALLLPALAALGDSLASFLGGPRG